MRGNTSTGFQSAPLECERQCQLPRAAEAVIIIASIWLTVVLGESEVEPHTAELSLLPVVQLCSWKIGMVNLIKEFDPCCGEKTASRRTSGHLEAHRWTKAGVERKSQMGINCTKKC